MHLEDKRSTGQSESDSYTKAVNKTYGNISDKVNNLRESKNLFVKYDVENVCAKLTNIIPNVVNDVCLHILYTNANIFTNKKADLEVLIQTQHFKPEIIIITKVNPKKEIVGLQEQEFFING